ncbi:4-hydroxy-2-oxovalerate aldolase [Candidatus Uhrbacteria bacterium]|nr:4-hydroxy-2-oxovalerate aldolase [Candidatus Uhrbacteria bacterium]
MDGSIAASFRSRKPVLGAWTSLAHPSIAEIFASAGVDFIGIDLEHSTISLEQAGRIIAAAHAGGIACLPRVSSHNGEQIKRLLDSGADGIIVPNVSTRNEVGRIVEWCKYPPLGKRSYGIARAQRYGFNFEEYTRTWNERSLIIIQIESKEGIEAADDLLSHDCVDGAMIGPYDLSGSLGIPGQLSDSRVTEACARVVKACSRKGRACGTHIIDPTEENVGVAFREGYTFVVLASDVFVLWKWSERMRELVARLRKTLAP